MTALRILTARDVRATLTMPRAIELMRDAMRLVATGETQQPIRQALFTPDRRGLLGLMPGYTARPERLGVKAISVFPGNFGTQFPSHQGAVVLFEARHGAPVAVVDAREITAIRTAAATAVGTDVLARRDARVLALLGYGEQAETHLEALLQVRPFERVIVWGRSPEKANAFAAAHAKTVRIETAASAEAAVRASDVICTLTAASDPVLLGRWLQPGMHVNAVGSGAPHAAEIDTDAVALSRFFADYKDSALALGGEIARAKAAGAITDAHVLGSIGDVLTGRIAGRQSDADVTVFKSLGMAAEDILSADFVLAEAERRGLGTAVEW